MTDPIDRCLGAVFGRLGRPGWWLDRAGNGRTPLPVLLRRLDPDVLEGRSPAALTARRLRLPPAAAAARAGDLVAVDRACWLLGGRPDTSPSGRALDWIATPLGAAPAFDAAGCPRLTWNGVAWVAGP